MASTGRTRGVYGAHAWPATSLVTGGGSGAHDTGEWRPNEVRRGREEKEEEEVSTVLTAVAHGDDGVISGEELCGGELELDSGDEFPWCSGPERVRMRQA